MKLYRYEVRIDEKLRRPVVIYIKTTGTPSVTAHQIRGDNIEDATAEAEAWIAARTPEAA